MGEYRPANSITVEVLLECGCMIATKIYSLEGVATIGHALSSAALCLPAQLQHRKNAHVCSKEPDNGC